MGINISGKSHASLTGGGTITGDFLVGNGYGVVIGHTAQVTVANAPEFQVLGTGGADAAMLLARFKGNDKGPTIRFLKSRNDTIGSLTIVQDNDDIGTFKFYADDGEDFTTEIAAFHLEVDDGSPTENDIGAAFVWSQMPGGGGAFRETMRLSAAGLLTVGGVPLGTTNEFYSAYSWRAGTNATGSLVGRSPVIEIDATSGQNDATITGHFHATPTAVKIIFSSSNSANLKWYINTDWSASGEAIQTATDSIGSDGSPNTLAMVGDEHAHLDLIAGFTGAVAGDTFGLQFTRDAADAGDTIGNLNIFGLLVEY